MTNKWLRRVYSRSFAAIFSSGMAAALLAVCCLRQDFAMPAAAAPANGIQPAKTQERVLMAYRWQPFKPVVRPAVPKIPNTKTADPAWARNPIDAFVTREQQARGLHPRPPASRATLLRRVTIDLTGLSPTPEELAAFEADTSPNAYEKVVERLLAGPRYGERWGRQWMDVWRYSDWAGWADGNQIRDSKPFIWRWRDWIVESLNADKGYDRMLQEMLAADELCPEDTQALRATGFLVRNYKLLSREQWLEDTLNHTSRAFMGVTLHCAKCHDHKYDPIRQEEYYRLRAVFEPHNVRTHRVPGQPDVTKDGLVSAYDAEAAAPTYLFIRGDERNPDKSRILTPAVPAALGGQLDIHPVSLPRAAVQPDRREFVIQETVAAGEQAISAAQNTAQKATSADRNLALLSLAAARSRQAALLAVLRVEQLEEDGKKASEEWKQAAQETLARQREQAAQTAEWNLETARRALAALPPSALPVPAAAGKATPVDPKSADAQKKIAEAQKAVQAAQDALKTAQEAVKLPLTTAYQPRSLTTYPPQSTGRRLAFARWLTQTSNPLTARVAVNQIWMRHFGQGLVPTVDNFGGNTRPPSNPQLLDWLASELMANGWRMKPLHRLIVTSAAYRQASTPDAADARIDPDNVYLWRMSSRRMEAEAVRDNMLYAAGSLDETRGGPEVDHTLGLTSHRRSLYLRTAAEKEVEFLKLFDSASVTECYERKPSVIPQQALALANSELALAQARVLAKTLSETAGNDNARFVGAAFIRVLARRPSLQEQKLCLAFLEERARDSSSTVAPSAKTIAARSNPTPPAAVPTAAQAQRAREHLVLSLFSHNDFVTIR